MATYTVVSKFPNCRGSIKDFPEKIVLYSLTNRGTFELWDAETNNGAGKLRFVSSTDFAEAFFERRSVFIQGYFLEWIYVGHPVELKGKSNGPGFETETGIT